MFKKIRILLAVGLILMATQSVAFAGGFFQTDKGSVSVEDNGSVSVSDDEGHEAGVDSESGIWVNG